MRERCESHSESERARESESGTLCALTQGVLKGGRFGCVRNTGNTPVPW